MHARELIELAALASAHGPALVQSDTQIPARGIEQYWASSKVRLDHWTRSLKAFTGQASGGRRGEHEWLEARGVLEEILTGEILTRVWTAVLCVYDRTRGTDEAEPVARSVLIGHVEARHRVLALMTQGTKLEAKAAVKLNRLRRRCERWTDLLVGRLGGLQDLSEFAADPERTRDFAEDAPNRRGFEPSHLAWPLLLVSLRTAFQRELGAVSPNADLNARIASGILACFPSQVFDSSGLLGSLWLMRITAAAEEAQVMIEELLAAELPGTRGQCCGGRHLLDRIAHHSGADIPVCRQNAADRADSNVCPTEHCVAASPSAQKLADCRSAAASRARYCCRGIAAAPKLAVCGVSC